MFDIMAFENLVFLLYPHPLKEEGLVVFFRSVLTFTAKGLLFAFGMAMFIVLAIVARETGGVLMPEDKWLGTRIVFTAASVVAGTATSLGTLFLLARSFRRFDPSRSALSG